MAEMAHNPAHKETASQTAQRECRIQFLQAAAAHPNVKLWDSLRLKVYEPSRTLWRDLGLPIPNTPASEYTPAQWDAVSEFRTRREQLIFNWAAGHNLAFEWVYDEARLELVFEDFPSQPFAFIPGYQGPQFAWLPWHHPHEDKIGYRKLMKSRFNEALEAYICDVEQKHAAVLNHRHAQASHYRWAVERVCLEWSWPKIAQRWAIVTRQKKKSWQSVSQAVRPILDRIGLEG